ncbi:hypothetical protein TOPH_04767 [Tolypocladium ophioglossoides CBS 100239]|uniref:Uncharacterized protein n=1 Tax=Tolypocladium ophioglossoides (strain CBS 100239) TaxID=1163406 RepID=A0A0L0N8V1_TOLOC|nr:hypothetical protein TOPH_04767 [Tolypocladium ophioglossoides CBS 100239]
MPRLAKCKQHQILRSRGARARTGQPLGGEFCLSSKLHQAGLRASRHSQMRAGRVSVRSQLCLGLGPLWGDVYALWGCPSSSNPGWLAVLAVRVLGREAGCIDDGNGDDIGRDFGSMMGRPSWLPIPDTAGGWRTTYTPASIYVGCEFGGMGSIGTPAAVCGRGLRLQGEVVDEEGVSAAWPVAQFGTLGNDDVIHQM